MKYHLTMGVIHGIPTRRERTWNIIKEQGEVTSSDLVANGIPAQTASDILGAFRRAGLIEECGRRVIGPGGRWNKVYRLKSGVSRTVSPPAVSGRKIDWRRQAWTTMRIKLVFTVPELMCTFSDAVSISSASVHRYCMELTRAGYLRRAGRARPSGQPLSHFQFRLVRDVGPVPPARQVLLEEARDDRT